MAVFGIDTSRNASNAMNTEATPLIGGTPKFWGRYFNGTSSTLYQYTASENATLAQLGIPVLCFARQMAHVSEVANAKLHAQNNMKGVIAAFGASYLKSINVSPIIYLDLEPEEHQPEHVMPKKYYEDWSAEICAGITVSGINIKFRPAVYLNRGDNQQSWLNLNAACVGGSICVGASVARYVHQV